MCLHPTALQRPMKLLTDQPINPFPEEESYCTCDFDMPHSMAGAHQDGAACEVDALDRVCAQLHGLGAPAVEPAQAVPDAVDLQ